MAKGQQVWDAAEQVQVQVPSTVEVSQGSGSTSVVSVPANVDVEASDHQTNFMLNASSADVANYARQGNDLVITLHNGGVVRIKGFLAYGADFNHVVFVGGDQAQPANVTHALAPQPATDSAPETPVVVGSADTAAAEPAADSDGPIWANQSLWSILGSLVVGVLGIASLGGGGSGSTTSTTTNSPTKGDTPPPAPTVATVADSNSNDHIDASGTAQAGSTVTVTWPDATTSTVTAGQDGKWSIESPTTQQSGAVTATATDAAGNVSAASAATTYTDVTKPPQTVTITMLVNNGVDHAGPTTVAQNDGSASHNITDTSPEVFGTLSAPLNAGEVLQVLRDGVVIGNATVTGTDWSYDDTDLTTGSSYVYTAQILDSSNNLGTASGSFTVDVVAASTTGVPSSGLVGTSASDTLTDAVTAGDTHATPFSIEGGGGNDTINLTTGGGQTHLVYSLLNASDPTGGNGSDTVNRFHVGAVTGANADPDADIIALSSKLLPADAANNLGNYVHVTSDGANTTIAIDHTGSGQFTTLLTLAGVDTTLAELTANGQLVIGAASTVTATIDSVLDDTSPAVGLVQSGGATNDPTPTLMGHLSAALMDDQSLDVLRNGVVVGTAAVSGTSWSFEDGASASTSLTDGAAYSYTVQIVNNADGELGAASAPFTLSFDESAPTATAAMVGFVDDVGAVTGDIVLSGSVTDDLAPQLHGTLSGTLGANEVVDIYRTDTTAGGGQLLMGSATVDGSNWTYQDASLTDGHSYSYVAQVVDAAGNQGAASSPFVINADATPLVHTAQITGSSDDASVPGILIPVDNGGYTNDATPLLSGTVSAALSTGEYVAIYRGDVMVGSATVTGTTWEFHDNVTPGSLYTYTARVENATNDHSETSSVFSLNVVTPPTATLDDSGDTINTASINVNGSVYNIISGAGDDTYTLNTGDGHIKLIFTTLDSTSSNGGNGSDTATGFHIGKVATDSDADIIDLSQLLPSTATTSNIASYLTATQSGSDTVLAVNLTGSSTATPATLLTLSGVSMTVDELMNNHQIVV